LNDLNVDAGDGVARSGRAAVEGTALASAQRRRRSSLPDLVFGSHRRHGHLPRAALAPFALRSAVMSAA
jgi:hypothetical protein